MKKGDKVVPVLDPRCVSAEVIAIEDLGHGKGNERVEVNLNGFRRYYAKKELQVAEEVESLEEREDKINEVRGILGVERI